MSDVKPLNLFDEIIATINEDNGFVLRKFNNPDFTDFDRAMTVREFVEIERYYANEDLYPVNGNWCLIERLNYKQEGKIVNVYIKFKEVKPV